MPRRKIRLSRWLLTSVIALLGWLAFVGGMIVQGGWHDQARPSDCAIVLGAAAYGPKPSPVLEERIRHAITLYQDGTVRWLLFTGGHGTGAEMAESEVARKFAMAHGVPAAAILIETYSRSTFGNLMAAKTIMQAKSLQSAILVSDPLHLKRASAMAADLKITAVTSPTPTSRYRSLPARLGFFFRELYLYHIYLITGS